MLADSVYPAPNGRLDEDLFDAHLFRENLIGFIAHCLPLWRDDSDRSGNAAERSLTQTLCRYLNIAAAKTPGFDVVQFEREVEDECKANQALDIAVMPGKDKIIVEGASYTKYKTLLQIECKRLPTPKKEDRDPREYIFSNSSSTGGIQRFKEGNHGAKHNFVAMIGYIQDKTCADWVIQIRNWIDGLTQEKQEGWSTKDRLEEKHEDKDKRTMILQSTHERKISLSKITIRHLWIEMN